VTAAEAGERFVDLSVFNPTVRSIRYSIMATCHVEGCARPVGFGSKPMSREAASLYSLLPILEQATDRWPDKFPEEIVPFIEMGHGLAQALHDGVHVAGPTPPPDLVGDWRAAAVETCKVIALVDPDWFNEHWHGVLKRGQSLPTGIARMLVTIQAQAATR
jgi:hypothetical protein